MLLLASELLAGQDFTHLDLRVRLDTLTETVQGTVLHRITDVQGGDSIFLNGIRMQYDTVRWNGKPLAHTAVDSGLHLQAPPTHPEDTIRLRISYQCQPRKGLYFSGWQDTTYRARRQIWTQGQGIDHRHWIPHHDAQTDKVIVSLTATFDTAYQVMSNGQLLRRERLPDGRQRWHYALQKPMSSYLIALVIGRYDTVHTRSGSGVPLTQYIYRDRKADYDWTYYRNEAIFNYLEKKIGVPYPWPNYKQAPVRDFRHGAMENTTATIFGDFFLVDSIAFQDRNYTYVNAHELAHQWHGNLVTARSSKHHWLHEGLATYYQWLSEAQLYGPEYYAWNRHEAAQKVWQAPQNDSLPLAHPQAGSALFYQKGAWVMYMLEQRLGTAVLDSALRQYLRRHAYGVVTTDSLRLSLERVCDCSLAGFFQQWVRQPGGPFLRVTQRGREGKRRLELRRLGRFALHLPVVAYPQEGPPDTTWLHWPAAAANDTSLPLPPKTLRYWKIAQLDRWLLRSRVRKPLESWQRQYRQSPALMDRYRAVAAMEDITGAGAQRFLESVLGQEEAHYGLRAQALKLLLKRKPSEKERLAYFKTALQAPEVNLQKEALALLPGFRPELAERLRHLRRQGRSYVLRKRAIERSINPQAPEQHKWLKEAHWAEQPGLPGHQVHTTVLAYRAALFSDRDAVRQLVDYSSPAYAFLTRINALELMAALQVVTEAGVPYIFEALFHPNWQLRRAARQTFKATFQAPVKNWVEQYARRHHSQWPPRHQKRAERLLQQLKQAP
ncbi:MAG: M1 family metallopeptidase [Schleiferiaceae bacterium]|nr:M1 family metallopeptidase [Schleiferiaceae bacterium]